MGLDTHIERTIRIPEELDKEQSEEEMEQPGTITEEEEVTSGEEEQVPDLKEKCFLSNNAPSINIQSCRA